jgi:acetoin utilization deacetylase AcuC-like enzyme
MDSPLAVIAAPEADEHQTPPWHPERRERIPAVLASFAEAGLAEASRYVAPRSATVEEVERVHSAAMIKGLRELCAVGGGAIDRDTFVSAGSYDTALLAAGAGLTAVEELRAGRATSAFCCLRPPGHHATRHTAMGFCLINSVAVTAASLVAEGERVVIVDWDVHHGNGTQDIFWNDPNVLYISTHEWPLYPNSGRLGETGGEDAPFSNLNVPLPPGTGGDVFRAAFDSLIVPVIERFAPTWMLVSAGFDAHRDDPLAHLSLTAVDYADFTTRLATLVPAARTVFVLEGGYDIPSLSRSVGSTLGAAIGVSYRPELASRGNDDGMAVLARARSLWQTGS